MTRQESWATGSSWIGNLQTRGEKTWKQHKTWEKLVTPPT